MNSTPANNAPRKRLYVLIPMLLLVSILYLVSRHARLDGELKDAVLQGDAPLTHSLLERGADPNTRYVSGRPANSRGLFGWLQALLHPQHAQDRNTRPLLIVAAGADEADIVSDLLKHGAAVNAAPENGGTALFIASAHKHSHVVRILLDHGANVRVTDSAGETPLFNAARQGSIEGVQLLLERGADVLARNRLGKSALSVAVLSERREVARLLLDHGADPKDFSTPFEPPLLTAARYGSVDLMSRFWNLPIVRPILSPALMSSTIITIKYASTPARVYVGSNAAEAIMARRRPVRSVMPRDRRFLALPTAAASGQIEAVRWLLDHGVPADTTSTNGDPAISTAIIARKLNIVSLLLDRGARVRGAFQGLSPLEAAIAENDLPTAKRLIQLGADIDPKSRMATPLLFNAVQQNSLEFTRFLIGHGVNANPIDKFGIGISGQTPLMVAMDPRVAKILLDHGAQVNAMNKQGQTPLLRAAMIMNIPLVSLLLAHGAQVNVADAQGQTPLSIAQSRRMQPLIDVLKAAGAAY